jgi:Ca-activated chloride channel family protein
LNYLEFKNPGNMIYIILPVLGLVILLMSYRKKDRLLQLLRIGTKARFAFLRIVLNVLGLSLIFFSMLGPQIFIGFEEANRTGLDIYVLVDTSKSMLVQDSQPDRLSAAKKIIGSIIDSLKGDRIGFIPFSSGAYVQMPLTDDYQVAGMFLDVVDTDMIGGGGTDIGAAIRLADNSFDRTSSTDRVVVILSDGEDHGTDSLNVLKTLNDTHLKVYTIGIGTAKGGLIPVYDTTSGKITDYKKDNSGNFVTSRLNPDSLQKLAASGNGAYYQASVSGNETGLLLKELSYLKRGALKTEKTKRYAQIYQYFLGVGILLFLTANLLPERRKIR